MLPLSSLLRELGAELLRLELRLHLLLRSSSSSGAADGVVSPAVRVLPTPWPAVFSAIVERPACVLFGGPAPDTIVDTRTRRHQGMQRQRLTASRAPATSFSLERTAATSTLPMHRHAQRNPRAACKLGRLNHGYGPWHVDCTATPKKRVAVPHCRERASKHRHARFTGPLTTREPQFTIPATVQIRQGAKVRGSRSHDRHRQGSAQAGRQVDR